MLFFKGHPAAIFASGREYWFSVNTSLFCSTCVTSTNRCLPRPTCPSGPTIPIGPPTPLPTSLIRNQVPKRNAANENETNQNRTISNLMLVDALVAKVIKKYVTKIRNILSRVTEGPWDNSGVEINFLTTCPSDKWYQMSTCPRKFQLARKKIFTLSFELFFYLWKKVWEIYFLAKTLNLDNTCILFRESSFCARLLW